MQADAGDGLSVDSGSAATAGVLEGGWTPERYAGLLKWIYAHPEKLGMSRAEFGAMVNERIQAGARGGRGGRGGAPPR